ncbi:MAG: MgtC/SapB family protein [Bacteroidales bacterium]|jgi:putative Mg2+ transporter-C (MgtC) family protein|nr:MgtC/SapB family protein [Bacteroidales bacterium]
MAINIFALRLLAAIIAGGVIGLERQRSNKSAGIRTNTLVAMGACMFVLVGVSISELDGTDPSRIISQIITGVGFLGAGVILQHKGSIRGLTTAATVWCSAALGVLGGMGMFWELAVCTAAIWLVNTYLKTDRFIMHDEKEDQIVD